MQRIWAIALNTFREAIRDRVLYGVVGFGPLVQLFALALGELAMNENARVVRDVGLAAVSLFAVIVAVFLGSSLLYKEIERKTLYVILPKPIDRTEFLLGKYAGIVVTACVFVTLMGALQLWLQCADAGVGALALAWPLAVLGVVLGVVWTKRDLSLVALPLALAALGTASAVSLSNGVATLPVLYALALTMGEVCLVGAVAIAFSSFSTPFLTGAFTVGVWLLGRSAGEMAEIRSSALPMALRSFLHALAWVVPNFHVFVPSHRLLEGAVDGQNAPSFYVATSLAYGAAYAAVLLAIASGVFRRRDFV